MIETFFREQDDDELVFADEDESSITKILESQASWKVLIVDDEREVHKITKLALKNFTFQGKSIYFLSAYSAVEAKRLLKSHRDVAIILLDVIMETNEAGLELVKYVREELQNRLVKIILRTGQPGEVPEKSVIIDYDIDDYKVKNELTSQKLLTLIVTGLRSFAALSKTVEMSRRELAEIASASERFVPKEFLKFLNKKSIVDAKLGDSVQAEMTILFADIRSFTTLSESMSPRESFNFINGYLSRVGPVIREYNGFVDKYIGDALLALFPGSAEDAVRAAIKMQEQITLYNNHRYNSGYIPIDIGISLHTGTLMIGTIGEEERMQSTVISDAVNLASRMESLTKVYGVKIIMSMSTLSQLDNPQIYHCRFLGRIRVRGKQFPVALFEVYDSDSPAIVRIKEKTKTDFEKGIILYYQNKYSQAQAIFNHILRLNPFDKTARLFKEHCEQKVPPRYYLS